MRRRLISMTCLTLLTSFWLQLGSAQPEPRVTRGNDLSVMARDPFQIFDNLYFVGIGEVGSYVIETSDGLILLDTLWDNEGYTEYHLGNIREVGLDPMDIKYVVILQGHRDHYGGAPALQKIIDAQFGTAEEDRKMMVEDFGEYAPRIDFIIEEGDTLTLGRHDTQFRNYARTYAGHDVDPILGIRQRHGASRLSTRRAGTANTRSCRGRDLSR